MTTESIPFVFVDAVCPICGSYKTRSKVQDDNGTWWFVCDNQIDFDHGVVVFPDGSERECSEKRWYFDLEGNIDFGNGQLMKVVRQENKP